MLFSLLNVTGEHSDGTVDGYWVRDHIGTYATALEAAARTEAVNSHRITVVVVERIPHPTPGLEHWTNRRRANA